MRRTFVLSGGGAFGALQVGALRALLERNIRPDDIVGCSVGALNAANVARDYSFSHLDQLADMWRRVTQRTVYPGGRLNVAWRVVTGRDSLHDNRSFYAFVQTTGCTPALTFGALESARLFVTATNLHSGRLHVFGDTPSDRVLDALMASTALTPLHPPWEVNGARYVDGGTVTPLPLRVALERGATEIYALHLHDPRATPAPTTMRGVAAHINQAVHTMLQLQAEHDLYLAGDARRVRLHYMALFAPFKMEATDFSHADALLETGYAQAAEFLGKRERENEVRAPLQVTHWWQSVWGRTQSPSRGTS